MLTYKIINKKYNKLPVKIEEKTLRNKLCVDFIGPYKISRKGEEPLVLKSVTMLVPVTGWFEITQYSNEKSMSKAKLVETTWMV